MLASIRTKLRYPNQPIDPDRAQGRGRQPVRRAWASRSGVPTFALPNGFQANWAPAIRLTPMAAPRKIAPLVDRAGQRHQDVLARPRHERGPDQAAQRPDVDVVLVAVEPVRRQGMGQLVHGQGQQATAPASRPVAGSCWSSPLAASDTAVVKSRNTTKMIRMMCTRTAVPNHRPRLIGDQVRESVMVPTRGRLRSRRRTSLPVSLQSNLTAAGPARNASPCRGRGDANHADSTHRGFRVRLLGDDRAGLLN